MEEIILKAKVVANKSHQDYITLKFGNIQMEMTMLKRGYIANQLKLKEGDKIEVVLRR